MNNFLVCMRTVALFWGVGLLLCNFCRRRLAERTVAIAAAEMETKFVVLVSIFVAVVLLSCFVDEGDAQ